MDQQKIPAILFFYLVCIFIISCNDTNRPAEKKIVADPLDMDQAVSESIKQTLNFALEHQGKINDSFHLKLVSLVSDFYSQNDHATIWSHNEKWVPLVDTMINFLQNSELYGLFSKDYHFKDLRELKSSLDSDSLKRMDAQQWTKADLLLTDGFMHLLKDLKVGRLRPDSAFLHKNDTSSKTDFYITTLKTLVQNRDLTSLVSNIEPKHFGYQELKKSIPGFLDSMDRKVYTYVTYPFKKSDVKDSVFFISLLQKRLRESGFVEGDSKLPDSAQLNAAIKKYQKRKGLRQDGKISAPLVRMLNLSDVERFKRIAITLL
ncbi:MAG: peptidoglycan-binding protein [Ferruginibacter sp.]